MQFLKIFGFNNLEGLFCRHHYFYPKITFYLKPSMAAGPLSVASPFQTLPLGSLPDGYSKQTQRTQDVTMWCASLAALGKCRNTECLETTHFTLNCRNSRDGYGNKVVVLFQYGYCQIKFRSGRELKICSCASVVLMVLLTGFNWVQQCSRFWCSRWQVSRKLSQ